MNRRHFLQLSVAAVSAMGLGGCSGPVPLRTGIHPWIGYEPLYLAEEFGWLPGSVELVKGAAATDSMRGLLSGELDAAAITLDEALRVFSEGVPLRVVAVADVSVGADVLVVKPDIASLSDLRGCSIGVELAGVSGVMLFAMLERIGLTSDQVSLVDLPVDRHLEAWHNGDIDASICYEPTASLLAQAGGSRLFDSSQMPDTIFDVLVVTEQAARRRPDAVRDLVYGHFRGLRHLVRSMHDAVYRVATRQGVSPDAVRQSLATVMLPELAANQRYLAYHGRIEVVARRLTEVLIREGMMQTAPVYERLADPSFLPRSVS
ncbi:MAG: NitT/TauT family transport system substrate-binding protein [Marinobacter excellens HL-55]|uniref:NitT/TauT family transport system substrate-binding protein n=1 Tax=Marinobacter excellens HL-55 TaxID=1305731 RepID=A0A0P7YHA4_9GAMM|nr:MAG: NitT/TauT family transport system substrate-binding protein [Marinobacter excellens HL-55]